MPKAKILTAPQSLPESKKCKSPGKPSVRAPVNACECIKPSPVPKAQRFALQVPTAIATFVPQRHNRSLHAANASKAAGVFPSPFKSSQ